MDSSFYLTLISNSSPRDHPENTTSSFTVHLAKPITLEDGNWRVALVEIHYPFTFLNVNDGNNKIFTRGEYYATDLKTNKEIIRFGGIDHEMIIEPGNYDSMESIVEKINENFQKHYKNDLFTLNKTTKRLCVDTEKKSYIQEINGDEVTFSYFENFLTTEQCKIDENYCNYYNDFDYNIHEQLVEVRLENRLSMQCGFPPNTNILDAVTSPQIVSLNMGLPQEIFIYWDFIEPQLIGHTCIPVLKIVNTSNKIKYVNYGSIVTRDFVHHNYFPLIQKHFQTIKIDIRTSTGEFAPFKSGVVTLQLHFMKTE